MTRHYHCTEQDLTLFHYNELESAERNRLQHHLQQCSACRAELDRLQGDLASVIDPAGTLSAAERQRFAGRVLQNRSRKFRHYQAFGGALTALTVLLAVFVWHPLQPSSTNNLPKRDTVAMKSTLSDETQPDPVAEAEFLDQLALVEQMELLQDLELLQNLELLQEFES